MNELQAGKIVESIVQTYDSIADHFDITRTRIWDEFRYFTPFLKKDQSVLDVGCGNGRSMELFENLEVSYMGVDAAPALVKLAAGKSYSGPTKPQFMTGDLLNLEKIPGTYDVILLVAVLQHIPKPFHEEAIRQLRGKLKPGGILLMTNWNLWQKKFLKMRLPNFIGRLARPSDEQMGIPQKDLGLNDFFVRYQKGNDAPVFQRYHYAFTRTDLQRLLEKNGFEILMNEYTSGFKILPWYRAKNIVTISKVKD